MLDNTIYKTALLSVANLHEKNIIWISWIFLIIFINLNYCFKSFFSQRNATWPSSENCILYPLYFLTLNLFLNFKLELSWFKNYFHAHEFRRQNYWLLLIAKIVLLIFMLDDFICKTVLLSVANIKKNLLLISSICLIIKLDNS